MIIKKKLSKTLYLIIKNLLSTNEKKIKYF